MALDDAALSGGFADPAMDAQATFRAIMDATARPGTVRSLRPACAPPALGPAAGAVLLTLADADTPVFLDAGLAASTLPGWLRFHTGAPLTEAPDKAALAVVREHAHCPPLGDFARGEPEYPDRSTTVVLEVAALDGGPPLALEGPGIAGRRIFAPSSLPPGFAAAWAANAALFPCGIDLLLTAGERIAGLPRSTRLVEAR